MHDNAYVSLCMIETARGIEAWLEAVLHEGISVRSLPMLCCASRPIHAVDELCTFMSFVGVLLWQIGKHAPAAWRMKVRPLHVHEEQFERFA